VCFAGCEQEIRTEQVFKDQLQTGAGICCFQETGSFVKLAHATRYLQPMMRLIMFFELKLQVLKTFSAS
jgi:hypothetical protein